MSLVLKGIQAAAWVLFATAWVNMGWVDWTEQKIRNRYLLLWLGMAAFAHFALLAHTAAGTQGWVPIFLTPDFYRQAGLYLGFSSLAALAFWMLRIWPAGDVKLFFLLSLFYPLMILTRPEFRSGLRFLEVLINVFVPACAALFVRAALYLWQTRFSHQKDFLVKLGASKSVGFLLDKLREAAVVLRAEAAGWKEWLSDPKRFLLDAFAWLTMVGVMSLVSYFLGSLVSSNTLKTLLCFGLFFGWSRFCMAIGKGNALLLALALLGAAAAFHPDVDWRMLRSVFGHISVFSLCLFFGIQLAFKIVAGHTGFVFMPLLFMLPGMIPWRSWLPSMPDIAPPPELLLWGGMGAFFGLSLVFVRIWDAESYQSVPPDHVKPYMTLGPSLVERIQADKRFAEKHFPVFYADGLMPDQVQALRRWCRKKGVDVVPLAPTVSFANWIFFGYLLTLLLDGHVLRLVY